MEYVFLGALDSGSGPFPGLFAVSRRRRALGALWARARAQRSQKRPQLLDKGTTVLDKGTAILDKGTTVLNKGNIYIKRTQFQITTDKTTHQTNILSYTNHNFT